MPMSNSLVSRKVNLLLALVLLLGLVLAFNLAQPRPARAVATYNCNSVSCLTTSLGKVKAGDTIVLGAGLSFTGNFVASANGSSGAPITLTSASSSSKATLKGPDIASGYGLHITGDYWVIKNIKVTNSQKGIMLDNSNRTVIDGVEVYNIGMEGVHFRDGSSNNTLKNSYVHDTGKFDSGFGEGIYVGSDKGKWGEYNAAVNNNLVSNVRIGPNVTAEHVDIKEGTSGTIIENCTFNGTGITGDHFADSFIDVKGNNAKIRNNTANRNGNSKILNAFEVHQQLDGWGLNADFSDNTLNLDTGMPYVINAASGTTAKAHNNTRSPSGNMYKGNVTTY